jgi:hypothetical protein
MFVYLNFSLGMITGDLPVILVDFPMLTSGATLGDLHIRMKPPPLSTHESRMKIFKLNPLLKGLVEEMVPTRGIEVPPLPSQR